jgi:hypothetical protein
MPEDPALHQTRVPCNLFLKPHISANLGSEARNPFLVGVPPFEICGVRRKTKGTRRLGSVTI